MHAILGVPLTETPPGTDWLLARVPPVERPYVQAISEGVSPDDVCEFQHRIVHTDGSLRTVLHRVLAEADDSGKVIRTVTLLQDITLQRAAEQKLDKLANTDEITGLPNRNALTEYLDTKMREAARGGRHIAVLSVEIDRLKLVSESLGHAAGDQLLMEVGRRLQPQVSQDDLLAHFGSGEFSLVLAREDSVDEAMARGTAASLVDALSLPVAIGDNEIKVTCDIGISLYPVHGDDPEKLLQQAQAAMYRAHELGKNQICVFSSGMHSKAISRLVMESGLRRALERNEFELHFQPKLELVSGAIIGAEAFLEWKSPDGALISRSSYIRAAEETGLIVPIGEWVLRTACLQALEWQRAGHSMCRVAVNLSARQLQQPDLAQKIEKILIETGLDPRLLGLEITEGALMGESTRIARILGDLKTLGIEISLDDFGTGYSSLSYLRTLPIDVVKVDRSFVHDVTAASQDVSITRAIINMAHSLQMRVLAEGVETEGQLALLIANGCDQMQGHYFSGLLTADAMGSLLRESKALPEHLLLRRAQQRTLLLVDDEDSIVSALRRLLRRDGYHIVTANSGAQGLQRLAENSVDVIVSDQRMPGMTGVEFLRRAKELYGDRFFFDLPCDPNKGMEEVRRIKRIHAEVGLSAISVFPAGTLPQVAINHKYMFPLYACAVELDIPICLNVGIPGPRIPMETQKVEHLDEVCWFFPDLKIVMRHGAEPWQDLAVKLMLKWPNLYYSTSAFAPKHYPKAIIDYANTRGADKIIYAGYFPMGLSLERIMSDMENVALKDEVWPKFLRDNARKVFKL